VIRKEEYDTSTIIRDLECLLNDDILMQEKASRIISLAVAISFHFNFSLQSILYYLYKTFRFNINQGETHLITTDCLDTLIKAFEKENNSIKLNSTEGNDMLERYSQSLEMTSFYESFKTTVVRLTIISRIIRAR
jgi:hypothetical protein